MVELGIGLQDGLGLSRTASGKCVKSGCRTCSTVLPPSGLGVKLKLFLGLE